MTIRSSTDVLQLLADGKQHIIPQAARMAAEELARRGVIHATQTLNFYQINPGVLSAAKKLHRLWSEDEQAHERELEGRMPRRPTYKGIPPIATPTEMDGGLQYAVVHAHRDGWTDKDMTDMIHEMRT